MENIKVKSRVEVLKAFHDKHLNDAMANLINIKLCRTIDPKEVVVSVPVKVPGTEQTVIRKITAGQQVVQATNNYNDTLDLLEVVEELMEENGYKFDDSETIKAMPVFKDNVGAGEVIGKPVPEESKEEKPADDKPAE